jgi:type IV pilus assembly protein PilO
MTKCITSRSRAESRADFYAAIPLGMSVTGNYHEIAVFFDSISKLKRIVALKFLPPALPRS